MNNSLNCLGPAISITVNVIVNSKFQYERFISTRSDCPYSRKVSFLNYIFFFLESSVFRLVKIIISINSTLSTILPAIIHLKKIINTFKKIHDRVKVKIFQILTNNIVEFCSVKIL